VQQVDNAALLVEIPVLVLAEPVELLIVVRVEPLLDPPHALGGNKRPAEVLVGILDALLQEHGPVRRADKRHVAPWAQFHRHLAVDQRAEFLAYFDLDLIAGRGGIEQCLGQVEELGLLGNTHSHAVCAPGHNPHALMALLPDQAVTVSRSKLFHRWSLHVSARRPAPRRDRSV